MVIPDLTDRERREKETDLGQVDLAAAPRDAADRAHPAAAVDGGSVSEGSGDARQKHEDLRCIAEGEIVERDVGENVELDMIGEDHQQGRAAQNVDPRVALWPGQSPLYSSTHDVSSRQFRARSRLGQYVCPSAPPQPRARTASRVSAVNRHVVTTITMGLLSWTLSKIRSLTASPRCERLFPPGRSRGLVRG